MRHHYTRDELADGLRAVGVGEGGVVFCHSSVGFFGYPDAGRTQDAICGTIYGAFRDALGDSGTLVVPTFTYSFPRGEVYDRVRSPSTSGTFTEWLRLQPGARRSDDPLFSVAALGPRAAELTADVSPECFGEGSFWSRLVEADGLVCNLNMDAGSTLLHYVERRLGVPYRQDRRFEGRYEVDGVWSRDGAVTFRSRSLDEPEYESATAAFDRLARSRGLVRTAQVGRGQVVSIGARDTVDVVEQALPERPLLLTVSGEADADRAGSDRVAGHGSSPAP